MSEPENLTSPGTVDDPELERERAEQAADRDEESRESSETKFAEQRREQEAERADLADDLTE